MNDWRRHWAGRARYAVLFTTHDQAAIGQRVQAWADDPARPDRLHLVAVSAAGALPGFERLLQEHAAVTLDLLHAPIDIALARLEARIDAVCVPDGVFDGVHARPLARLLTRDASLWAPALTGDAWAALVATGFQQEPEQGAGVNARFATRKPIASAPASPERRAIVIGAGLAGAAACERLCARGWDVTLIEQHATPASEASGNLAGITLPMLSKDDNRGSRLSRASYLFALRYWQQLGGVGPAGSGAAIEGECCGVLLAARDVAHARLQQAIADARALPAAYAVWRRAGEGAGVAQFARVAPHGAWLFPQGGWMRPASAVAAMLAACGARLTERFNTGPVTLARAGDLWEVRDANHRTLASAATVIIASGGARLAQTAGLPLTLVRGQVTHLDEAAAAGIPALGLVLCREAYLTPAAGAMTSVGATYDDDLDPALRQSSQDHNLDKLRSMLADESLAPAAPLAGRVGFRSVATDRLPMVGALPEPGFAAGAERLRELPRQPGLYGLLGYASRGLTWAPLAAELLAATLEGEPLPVERDLAEALDPGRFLLRARRTGGGRLR